MRDTIKINTQDSVSVALRALEKGETVEGLTLLDSIPMGHKVALKKIEAGEPVIKYGYPIGLAKTTILPGQWIHSHNLKTALSGTLSYTYEPNWQELPVPKTTKTFLGFRREDGKVGVRNEVWIIPTVGCVNAIAKEIEKKAQSLRSGSIDGIYTYTHPYGCSQLGEDHGYTQKALCGLISHPNAGAVLVLGLGCENNNIDEMKQVLGEYNPRRVAFVNCQDQGDEVAAALAELEKLCAYAAGFQREECDAGELVLGMKCGGSDGFSGITANALIGDLTRRVTSREGRVILTEVPEMFGAETILMNRCRDRETFEKTVALINSFKEYFLRYGQPVGENPSPGNKEGGITTLEEKSLGCVQKGADAPVSGVLDYGEPVTEKGLNLLKAPGNDLVSSAALAISGAQMVLFSTGRGTPFGCPVPTVKVSSNSQLAQRKPGWIDFDAGPLLTGTDMETLGEAFMDFVLDVASGKRLAHSESRDKSDLAIFKDGVTL